MYVDSERESLPTKETENNEMLFIPKQKGTTILIVEDEKNIRELLKDILLPYYQVCEAADGEEALKEVEQKQPDIIISDVLMPKLDGITLTNVLKSNERTAHIPIIHISAKNSIEDQINAYNHGTDLYIPKPFHPRHVLSAVENIINKYSLMKEYFKSDRSSLIVREGITMYKEDELLLNKIIKFIEDNIDDESMNPDSLADFIGISKAGLYRKLKELTEKTPSEFVRTVRLKYAANLLRTTKLTVTEIMYKSGFSYKSYFYREFAKLYNTSPQNTEVNKQKKKLNNHLIIKTMRTLLIVLVLCSMSILNAQQLNVATYNVRNSNSNDDKEGNGWEQRCPVPTQLIIFHDFDILEHNK